MIYVVDTQALIWFLERSARLGKTARQALVDPSSELVLPTIVLAETRYLAGTRRIRPSWEGLADVRVIQALYRSADSGQPVTLEPFTKEDRPSLDQEIRRPAVSKPELVNTESPTK